MSNTIKNGLFFIDGEQVPFDPTPNKTIGGLIPLFIMVHLKEFSDYKQLVNWYKKPYSKQSAHIIIDGAGNIIQMGNFNEILWHSTKDVFEGEERLQDKSIGIVITEYTSSARNKLKSLYDVISEIYLVDMVVTFPELTLDYPDLGLNISLDKIKKVEQ